MPKRRPPALRECAGRVSASARRRSRSSTVPVMGGRCTTAGASCPIRAALPPAARDPATRRFRAQRSPLGQARSTPYACGEAEPWWIGHKAIQPTVTSTSCRRSRPSSPYAPRGTSKSTAPPARSGARRDHQAHQALDFQAAAAEARGAANQRRRRARCTAPAAARPDRRSTHGHCGWSGARS